MRLIDNSMRRKVCFHSEIAVIQSSALLDAAILFPTPPDTLIGKNDADDVCISWYTRQECLDLIKQRKQTARSFLRRKITEGTVTMQGCRKDEEASLPVRVRTNEQVTIENECERGLELLLNADVAMEVLAHRVTAQQAIFREQRKQKREFLNQRKRQREVDGRQYGVRCDTSSNPTIWLWWNPATMHRLVQEISAWASTRAHQQAVQDAQEAAEIARSHSMTTDVTPEESSYVSVASLECTARQSAWMTRNPRKQKRDCDRNSMSREGEYPELEQEIAFKRQRSGPPECTRPDATSTIQHAIGPKENLISGSVTSLGRQEVAAVAAAAAENVWNTCDRFRLSMEYDPEIEMLTKMMIARPNGRTPTQISALYPGYVAHLAFTGQLHVFPHLIASGL